MSIPTLLTPRLVLHPLQLAHADSLYKIFNDSKTLAYWHTRPHQALADTRAMVSQLITNAASPWWAIVIRDTDQLIGMTGYYLDAAVPGLGYIVHREYWRQGYGSEAVSAAVEHGFTNFDLNRIELWIHEGNIPSQRLASKLGFKQRGQFYGLAPAHTAPYETLVFGLRASEWHMGQASLPQVTSRETAFFGVCPVIPTSDLQKTLAFYCDLLGFRVDYTSGEPPEFAIVSRGEWASERAQLHFSQRSEPAAFPGSLYFPVGPQLGDLYNELRARGVIFEAEPADQPWGRREFRVIDNNSMLLVFGASH